MTLKLNAAVDIFSGEPASIPDFSAFVKYDNA
jgi:hypothetical protein